MNTKCSKFKSILPKAISAFLAFWLSSVLVLVCCGSHLFTISASNLTVEEENSCPMKGHDCCKKTKAGTNVSEVEEDKDDCCVFKPTKTLSSDLQGSRITKDSQVVIAKFETRKPVYFIQTFHKVPKIYHSAIRNRGSTYLTNCVFRI